MRIIIARHIKKSVVSTALLIASFVGITWYDHAQAIDAVRPAAQHIANCLLHHNLASLKNDRVAKRDFLDLQLFQQQAGRQIKPPVTITVSRSWIWESSTVKAVVRFGPKKQAVLRLSFFYDQSLGDLRLEEADTQRAH